MVRFNRRTLQLLSRRLRVSEDILTYTLEQSYVQMEGSGKNCDLSAGTALRLRRIQRLAENLGIDAALASLLLERIERISRLEKEVQALRRLLRGL